MDTNNVNVPQRVAIIAGAGDFPKLVARAARSANVEVIVFGVRGFAESGLADLAHHIEWIELGQLDYAIQLLHKLSVSNVILAGRIPHTSIFQYRHFDFRAVKLLARAVNKKADTLLGILSQELEKEGIHVLDSSIFLKSLMPQPGLLTSKRALTAEEEENIAFGWPIAKSIAGLDIGQTIVVKDKMVVAVEAAEGTDECIARAAQLAGPGCVVIKVSKPNQDLRFDIPVIGKRTIETMIRARASTLAISARECLVFDQDVVLAEADAHGIVIVACEKK